MRRVKNQSGFTLAEVAVSLSVAGLVMASTLGAVDRVVPDWRLREAANSLAVTLRAARARAILEATEVSVPFDVQKRRYTQVARTAAGPVQIVKDTGGEIRRLVTLPHGVSFARPNGETPVTLRPPESDDLAAVFNSKGLLVSAETPAYAYLGNAERGAYRRVSVNVVGIVKVEEWSGRDWE